VTSESGDVTFTSQCSEGTAPTYCRKHAFARSGRFVVADIRSRQPKCWSELVNYGPATPNASEGLVHRYYDPTTAQFLSIDPELAKTGQPYAYTADDPLNATDPLGDCPRHHTCRSRQRSSPSGRSSPSRGRSRQTSHHTRTTTPGQATTPYSWATVSVPMTNDDWGALVLHDGGFPDSQNNMTFISDWMASEQSNVSNWWTGGSNDTGHINPLNNGLGSGGGAGLGSYPNLVIAAQYTAENLNGGLYQSVVTDLATSAAPQTTAQAIWQSPWASGHYSNASGVPGSAWHTSQPIPVVTASPSLWGYG